MFQHLRRAQITNLAGVVLKQVRNRYENLQTKGVRIVLGEANRGTPCQSTFGKYSSLYFFIRMKVPHIYEGTIRTYEGTKIPS